jgi:hypothetical protein
MTAGAVHSVRHANHCSSCTAEIFSGSWKVTSVIYLKAVNEIIILLFGRAIDCVTVKLQA